MAAWAAAVDDDIPRMLQTFYAWYKPQAEHSEPIGDPRMRDYVTDRLLARIADLRKSEKGEVAELDYDPFLNAQDVLSDWKSHIAVSDVKVKGDIATAKVLLGKKSRSTVRLHLVRSDGHWKIDNFTPKI